MSIYTSGEYWDQAGDLHVAEGVYKADCALDMLRKAEIRPRSFVDVGCGAGAATRRMAEGLGVPGLGLDLSERPLAHARANFAAPGLDYRLGGLSDVTETPDLGILFDIFEHVEDYIGFLRDARPRARWWAFNVPMDMNVASVLFGRYMEQRRIHAHLHYFSAPSAVATLEHCGYRDIRVGHYPAYRTFFRLNPSLRRALALVPREVAFRLSPALCTRLFGATYVSIIARGAD